MFNPSREDVRRFFFESWRKYRMQAPLEGLEKTALEVVLLHPEYQTLLDSEDHSIGRDFGPEGSELNPFLHLSLHLALAEQISIDQPRGIRGLYAQLLTHAQLEHDALHVLLECLGETIWQAQRDHAAPDEVAYLDCIRRKLG
ncbi:MAG TPA: DUF1841 family protein [Burkholderiales bacterium]|nr:DUF1841 family protein [Burkholderiales bacterium]